MDRDPRSEKVKPARCEVLEGRTDDVLEKLQVLLETEDLELCRLGEEEEVAAQTNVCCAVIEIARSEAVQPGCPVGRAKARTSMEALTRSLGS